MTRQPALFVSHGSPMIAIEPSPARDFLAGLGPTLDRPRAILVVSAHHDETGAVVTASPAPPTIHDFGGFPQALFDLRYPAPGDPALAQRVADLLAAAGVPARLDPERGLDHGAWSPLLLAFPDAGIPVVQLSIDSERDANWHFALGEALRPLRDEGVLIVASGSLTHNLRAWAASRGAVDAPAADWAVAFADWIDERFAARDFDSVLHAIERAPTGRINHPTPEHLMPLFVAMGAGDAPRRLHHSMTYGVLAMDAYRFD